MQKSIIEGVLIKVYKSNNIFLETNKIPFTVANIQVIKNKCNVQCYRCVHTIITTLDFFCFASRIIY